MARWGGPPTGADSLLPSMGAGHYRTMSTEKTELHRIVSTQAVITRFTPQTGMSNLQDSFTC